MYIPLPMTCHLISRLEVTAMMHVYYLYRYHTTPYHTSALLPNPEAFATSLALLKPAARLMAKATKQPKVVTLKAAP